MRLLIYLIYFKSLKKIVNILVKIKTQILIKQFLTFFILIICQNVVLSSDVLEGSSDIDDFVHVSIENLLKDPSLDENMRTELGKMIKISEKIDEFLENNISAIPNNEELESLTSLEVNTEWDFILSMQNEKEKIKKIKEKVFDGIPNIKRLEVWRLLLKPKILNVEEIIIGHHNKYLKQILLDIPRLKEKHDLLSQERNKYICDIYNLLCRFVYQKPEIGYWQGMDYIAVVFAICFQRIEDENLKFSIFAQTIEIIYKNIANSENSAFHHFSEKTRKIIEKTRPNIYKALNFDNFKLMFLFEYYFTIFCRLEIKQALRFLDVFYAYGIQSLHYFVVAILDVYGDEIIKTHLEKQDLMEDDALIISIKNKRINSIDIDELMNSVKKLLKENKIV
ncbi:hypothetical protein H311_00611 [Anncaliia algerae PRA109]|nr:hypothetical protein H311_00611 [Anncaliia algerae PRA109]